MREVLAVAVGAVTAFFSLPVSFKSTEIQVQKRKWKGRDYTVHYRVVIREGHSKLVLGEGCGIEGGGGEREKKINVCGKTSMRKSHQGETFPEI